MLCSEAGAALKIPELHPDGIAVISEQLDAAFQQFFGHRIVTWTNVDVTQHVLQTPHKACTREGVFVNSAVKCKHEAVLLSQWLRTHLLILTFSSFSLCNKHRNCANISGLTLNGRLLYSGSQCSAKETTLTVPYSGVLIQTQKIAGDQFGALTFHHFPGQKHDLLLWGWPVPTHADHKGCAWVPIEREMHATRKETKPFRKKLSTVCGQSKCTLQSITAGAGYVKALPGQSVLGHLSRMLQQCLPGHNTSQWSNNFSQAAEYAVTGISHYITAKDRKS